MISWLRKNVQAILICLLCVLFVAFASVIFSVTAEGWISQRLGLTEKIETLKFLGISMGGVLLGLQAVIANNRAAAMENSANAQVRATVQQTNANEHIEKGLRQDRLKNAIEHLGNKEFSVRMGGAYELFHLAQDTKDLRQAVLDIFCAHIRYTTSESEYRKMYRYKPSEEIQSLLTLLFIQNDNFHTFRNLHVNLRGSWLNGVQLPKARLENANLAWTSLCNARLFQTRLHGADISFSNLQKSSFIGANLQGTDLDLAMLQGANFYGTKLQGASLHKAQLQQATLNKTQLHGVMSHSYCHLTSFEERLRHGINTISDLSRVTLSGGLKQEDLDYLVKNLSSTTAKVLREDLMQHVDIPASHELPENSGAFTGCYTEEEAENWISEYKNHLAGV